MSHGTKTSAYARRKRPGRMSHGTKTSPPRTRTRTAKPRVFTLPYGPKNAFSTMRRAAGLEDM